MTYDIVYFSGVTNNTHRFVEKLLTLPLGSQAHRIPIKGNEEQPVVQGEFILVVPSYGTETTQHVPPQVKKFLSDAETRGRCVGIIGTGNRNFGPEYVAAAKVLSHKLQVPLLYALELAGDEGDILQAYRAINHLNQSQNNQEATPSK